MTLGQNQVGVVHPPLARTRQSMHMTSEASALAWLLTFANSSDCGAIWYTLRSAELGKGCGYEATEDGFVFDSNQVGI